MPPRRQRVDPQLTNMYNLPKDLEEEVLSRVPMTSMRKVRFTCKKWNTLSKGRHFAKKHLDQARTKKCMVVMIMHYKIYLMSIDLNDNVESCIQREAKLISLDDSYRLDFVNVFHCDGLLLCITRDYYPKLVVWNPYWGQTRCIEPSVAFHTMHSYSCVIGYDKSNRIYKILTFTDLIYKTLFFEIKMYDLNSDSWRVLDLPPPEEHITNYHGVSLKGDTYWFAENKHSQVNSGAFLVSFDFTKERFGPLLPLPFEWFHKDTVTLSSVNEEKLAVMFQRQDTLMLEIWITTKIEPNAVSWSDKVFLAMDMRPLTKYPFGSRASFFIDDEKKVAVVFDKEKKNEVKRLHGTAFIIGVDGSLKEVYLGKSPDESCYSLYALIFQVYWNLMMGKQNQALNQTGDYPLELGFPTESLRLEASR